MPERYGGAMKRQRIGTALVGAGVLLLVGCSEPDVGEGRLAEIRARGELVVITRNAPTTFYEGRDGLAGPEYEMVESFAEYLGVSTHYIVIDNWSEMLSRIERGDADLAAAGITRTSRRMGKYLFGPGYQTVEQQVICRRDGESPRGVEELSGIDLKVLADSSYEERLRALRRDYADLEWTAETDLGSEQLLEEVWQGRIGCTVADSNIVAINRRYYPELDVAFTLGAPQTLAWAMPKGASELLAAVRTWFEEYEQSGDLDDLVERYYGFVDLFDYVDVSVYRRRIEQRLPKYQTMFERAGEEYGIPWSLLAAQSYQESHWNPRARSPTGVRGMMMLTLPTARSLGVKNRLDARQSIMGGASYLAHLRSRLDPEIQEPDRTWFALAAYNVGLGHVRDARRLTEEMGRNPNLWIDLKEALPLLSDRKYYRRLPHGYARGSEPVRYVQRVRDFHDILEQQLGIGVPQQEFDLMVERAAANQ